VDRGEPPGCIKFQNGTSPYDRRQPQPFYCARRKRIAHCRDDFLDNGADEIAPSEFSGARFAKLDSLLGRHLESPVSPLRLPGITSDAH